MRSRVQRPQDQHRGGRAVRSRLRRDQPQRQDSLDRRFRRPRRRTHSDDGIGRDPDLPFGEDRQIPAEDGPRQIRSAAVADVPDGPRRADVRPGAPFPARGERAGPLRDRALYEGEGPALRRARPAPGGSRVSRRRILDRRHRYLPLGRALRVAQDRFERLAQRETLVQRDQCKAGGKTRNGGAFLNQPFLAYLTRNALISSILSCGWSGSRRLPTTRFIHSMFFSMRVTTAGHSEAVWRRGSGSTWHCWQASLNDRPSGRSTAGYLLGSSARWLYFCR